MGRVRAKDYHATGDVARDHAQIGVRLSSEGADGEARADRDQRRDEMTDREGAGEGLRQKRIGQLGRTPEPALTAALLVVQASGEISVHALVRVHRFSPSLPIRALAGAQGHTPPTPSPHHPPWPPDYTTLAPVGQ